MLLKTELTPPTIDFSLGGVFPDPKSSTNCYVIRHDPYGDKFHNQDLTHQWPWPIKLSGLVAPEHSGIALNENFLAAESVQGAIVAGISWVSAALLTNHRELCLTAERFDKFSRSNPVTLPAPYPNEVLDCVTALNTYLAKKANIDKVPELWG